jgi:hypothetical protein
MPNTGQIIKAMQQGRPVYYVNEFSKVINTDTGLMIRHKYGPKIPLINPDGTLHGKETDYIIKPKK